MIFLLLITTGVITIIAYNYSRLYYLSPTLWSSGMFTIYSLIYAMTYSSMKNDISFSTYLVIFGALIVVAIGEYMATHIKLKVGWNNSNAFDNSFEISGPIYVSRLVTFIISIIYLIVALSRLRNLSTIAQLYSQSTSFSDINEMMYYARLASLDKAGISLGSFIPNQIVYFSEVSTYIYIFIFLYNAIIWKKRQWYLLLPLIPDILMRFVGTSRTSYVMLAMSIVVLYFGIKMKSGRYKKIKIPRKMVIGGLIFVFVFIVYGRVRNNASTIPIVSYIQMYTCSSIYALDYFLGHRWGSNPYFGYFTLNYLYNSMGIERIGTLSRTNMITFAKNGAHANIYTSLTFPIQDYGIAGMLLIRLVLSIVCTLFIVCWLNGKLGTNKFYVYIYLVVVSIYAFINYPILDGFYGFLGNPGVLIRYLLYAWILVRFILRINSHKNHKVLFTEDAIIL